MRPRKPIVSAQTYRPEWRNAIALRHLRHPELSAAPQHVSGRHVLIKDMIDEFMAGDYLYKNAEDK